MTDKRDTAGFSQGERIDDAPYTPSAEKLIGVTVPGAVEDRLKQIGMIPDTPPAETKAGPPKEEEEEGWRKVRRADLKNPLNIAYPVKLCPQCGHSAKGIDGKCAEPGCNCEADRPVRRPAEPAAPVSPPKCSADLGEIGRCSRPKGHEGTCMIGWGESPVSPEPALRVVKYVDCDCAEEYSHHCPQCGGTGRKAVMVAFNPADSASHCQHYVLGGECQKCGGIFREAGTVGAKPEPQFPIGNTAMITRIAKEWSKDDRLWTTQETVAFNLATFARAILFAHATVQPRDCPIPGEVAPVSPPRITESYVEQLRFERDLLQGAQDRYMNLMYALADEECDIEKLRAEVRQTLGEK